MTETKRISLLLERAAQTRMTLPQIIAAEITEFEASPERRQMIEGELYYRNRSDVQRKTNPYPQRSNTRIEHSVFRKLVDQKTNYLLSRPFSIRSENSQYADFLGELFDTDLRRVIKSWGKEAIKKGIAWVQIYFDEEGRFRLKRLPSEQVIPEWADEEHTQLDCLIRYYPQTVYEGANRRIVLRAEYWDKDGVQYFVSTGDGRYVPDVERGVSGAHFTIKDKERTYQAPPFMWVKYTEEELGLLWFVKDLIDDINWQTSITADVLRDIANFIFVLRGYGGQDLEEFVVNLRKALAIEVAPDGGVDKLAADLNIDAVAQLLDRHRRDLYDYARSVDTQDPNLGDASGQALKFRYADLDMDVNDLEQEFRSAFGRLRKFWDEWAELSDRLPGAHEAEFEVVFDRDIIVNEAEAVEMCRNSAGMISEHTLLANHPWVTDPDEEQQRLEKERQEGDDYAAAFQAGSAGEDEDDE